MMLIMLLRSGGTWKSLQSNMGENMQSNINWSGDYIRELAEALREIKVYLDYLGWSGYYIETDYTEELKYDITLMIKKEDLTPQKALRKWDSFYKDITMFEHRKNDGEYLKIMKHLNVKIKIMGE